MPALDPLAEDVMKLFKVIPYEECCSLKPLTRIEQNFTTNTAWLVMEQKLKKSFTWKRNKLDCCYQQINRSGANKTADDEFKYAHYR